MYEVDPRTETFMMISNWKKTFVAMAYTKIFQRFTR